MPTPSDYYGPGYPPQPSPPPPTPPVTVVPLPPPPKNADDPTKTQEAAVPRMPPPARPAENIDQPTPPTPGSYRPPPLYTPPALPWREQQPPPAEPAPPLGAWTHEDNIPQHVQPKLTLSPPNREPDAYKGGAPVYYLRPGERGYGQGGNVLLGLVAKLEQDRRPDMNPQTYGQKAAFQAQYGPGPQGVMNYANQLLRYNPNATLADFYAGYTMGTGNPAQPPSLDYMRAAYPAAYRNLFNNANAPPGMPLAQAVGGILPGTPAGPQGPWTQQNLVANFAERTGQLGQPGNIPLTTVKAPNGQGWEVNQRVAPQFQGFLNDLYKAGYTGMVSSGGYANRPIRGGTIPSEHAYGAAIDIGAEKNPMQYASAGAPLRTDLPANVGEIAAKWGLKWGGTFHDRQDPMHFEVAAIMTPQQLEAARNGQVTTSSGTDGRVIPAAYRPGGDGGGLPLNTPLASLMGGAVSAPVQNYVAPRGREPSQWGQPPDNEWTPGRMPQSHDMPGIMKGLLPLIGTILIGFAGKGALGAVTAFGAYQNARNKGQLEAAKEQKTYWQDHLKETSAALKEELLGASGIVSQFGYDASSPQAQKAWGDLANEYDDPQLRAAIANNDSGAIKRLFDSRDAAFQTLSKTTAASTKADEQAKQDAKDQETEREWGVPGAGGGAAAPAPAAPGWAVPPPGSAPAAATAPPAPAAPEEGQPPPPQPSAQPSIEAPPPGVAPDTAGQPPPVAQPPATGPAGAGAAPPTGRPGPAYTPGPGEEPPLPDVNVTAPTAPPTPTPPAAAQPAPAAAPAPPPAAPRSVFDELVSEGVNGQDIEKFKAGVPKDMLPKLQGAIAQKNAQIDAVQPGPNAAAQLAAIDPNFAGYAIGVSRYTAALPGTRATSGRAFTTRVQEAAKKINPQWNFANYKKQEEFADPKGSVQIRLTRASTMGEATVNGMKALKVLQDAGVEVDQDKISEAIDRAVNGLSGDPRYMAIANAILAFTQEDQALRTGNPSVTETEAQQALVAGHVFLGSIESIRTYFQQNIDTADAAITHYQGQWKQMQGYGDMPGTDPDADAIISSMKYLDPKTGQYHMPKGTQLPPGLTAGIPEHAPPPTVLPKPGTTAPPAPAPTSGEVIQNGWRYDAKTHQPLGPAQ